MSEENPEENRVVKVVRSEQTVDEKNYRKILGVDEDATPEKIKEAFKKLALQYHPDKNPSHEEAQKFYDIKNAFEKLYNKTQGTSVNVYEIFSELAYQNIPKDSKDQDFLNLLNNILQHPSENRTNNISEDWVSQYINQEEVNARESLSKNLEKYTPVQSNLFAKGLKSLENFIQKVVKQLDNIVNNIKAHFNEQNRNDYKCYKKQGIDTLNAEVKERLSKNPLLTKDQKTEVDTAIFNTNQIKNIRHEPEISLGGLHAKVRDNRQTSEIRNNGQRGGDERKI